MRGDKRDERREENFSKLPLEGKLSAKLTDEGCAKRLQLLHLYDVR